jgi:thiopeptide-type bacteriocin biosynthesis protein
MEYWVEINLFAKLQDQNRILLDILWPYAKGLRKRGTLVSYHYFREPEIRFRVRVRSDRQRETQAKALDRIARRLKDEGSISKWAFGNHGKKGTYVGETDRYGHNGWKVAQKYFEDGAETALRLLALMRKSSLENPLWATGLGNPWEGGKKNPWREKVEDPLAYHWSRHTHLFTNQLGLSIEDEVNLSEKQAEKYRKVAKKLGKW